MNIARKERLQRRALLLSYLTVGYNVLEGMLAIVAGASAGSIALIGFGLDSFIESISGGVMIWRFSQGGRESAAAEARLEKRATRLIACTFFVLGAYVGYQSIKKLVVAEAVGPSLPGIIIASVSLILMPVLFYVKLKTARALNSSSLIACCYRGRCCWDWGLIT